MITIFYMLHFPLVVQKQIPQLLKHRSPQPVKSTVFKIIEDDATKSGKAITFLGKKISDIRKDLKDHKGILNSLFKSSENFGLSDEQVEIFNRWNHAIEKNALTQEKQTEILKNADKATQKYFNNLKGGKATLEGLAKSTGKVSIGAKAASFAMGALKTAANIGLAMLASWATDAIITKIQDIVNAYQNGIDKVRNLSNEIKSLESEQSDLNSELKKSKERLNELQQIKMSTLFEKDEIENLKEYNEQLEQQLRLKNLELEQKKQSANSEAQESYNSFFNTPVDRGMSKKDTVDDVLNTYKRYQEAYEKSVAKGDEWTAENNKNALENIKKHWADIFSGYTDDLNVMLEGLNPDKDENAQLIQDIKGVIQEINELYYLGTTFNTPTEVYESADYSDVVTQLEALAKAGKLTEETFNKVEGIDKFKEALEGVGETDIAYIITSIIAKVNESEAAFRNAVVGVDAYSEAIEKVGTVISGKNTFDNAADKIKGGENLSYDEVQGLIALNPSIAQDITKTADGYVIAVDKIIAARDEYVKENGVDFINGEVDSVNTSIAEAEATIAEYSKEKAKIYEELFANKDNEHFDRDSAYTRITEIDNRIKELKDSIQDGENAIAGYNLSLDELAGESDTTKTYAQIVSGVEEVTSKLKSLANVYNDVKEGESFDWSSVLNNEEFKKTFAGCGETYTQFIETVTQSPDNIEACQSAFNNLVGEYINASGVLNDLTEDTRDAAVAMLEQGGIVNAAEIVDAKLKQLAVTREHEAEMTSFT